MIKYEFIRQLKDISFIFVKKSMMKKLTTTPLLAFAFLYACNAPSTKTESSTETNKQELIAFDIRNMDTTVSACDNFYQYAIGGWLKNNPVPSTESRWSSFNIVSDSNDLKIKRILEEYASKDFEDGSMQQKIGDFYKSIMDSVHIEELGYQPIQKEIEKIAAIKSSKELITLVAEQRSISINSLFGVYVGQDNKNSEQYITRLSQAGIGLPDRDYYTNEDDKSKEIQTAYIKHISNTFKLVGKENPEKFAKKVYEIESALAKASMTRVDSRNPDNTYNKMSYETLKSSYPNINWDIYFTTIGLQEFDSLIVSQPDFFAALNKMITERSIDEWKTYLNWRLLNAYSSELNSDFVNENFDFYGKTLSGTQEMKPLWKRALGKLNHNIGELVGKAFVAKHFSKEAKEDVGEMVENLRSVFKDRINKLEWMSEHTKEQAIEKLEAFNYKIGYPDVWRNYDDLTISADNKVENIFNSRKFNFNLMIQKLGKPIDPNEWFMSPQTVNAYYASSKNEIVFPAGILQPPFYSVNFDDAVNYGGIGAVIGHEFTHGFDDQGSKYDASGNLQNWWTAKDRERFDSRAQKVIDQFNKFEPLDSLFVNGELTLGENIADLGGATLAFHALEKEIGRASCRERVYSS